MIHPAITAIEYYLPEHTVSASDLSAEFPDWSVEKIDQKTGIRDRHIAAPDECSSDLAVAAATKLFESGACEPKDLDYLLLCTQSPDFFLPTTACLIQERLRIPTTAGALDFNLGCSGFVYGLGLAQGLIISGQANRVLLLTAETYSKFVHFADRSARTIFGDAAAATLVAALDTSTPSIGPFVYGTDGRGAENLIVRGGGMRYRCSGDTVVTAMDAAGNIRSQNDLYMNGAEIFNFTLDAVPQSVQALLQKARLSMDDIELFVFHQANRYMLEHLRKRMKIAPERFQVSMAHCGNTVSSTIPIALKHVENERNLPNGAPIVLVGFGVGYSWGATLIRWRGLHKGAVL